MNIEQLRFVYEAARTGSFSSAAETLYLTQPSVSIGIAKLEKELGNPIFRRGRKGISLTPFGREILPYIRNIIGMIDQMPAGTHSRGMIRTYLCSGGSRLFSYAAGRLYMNHSGQRIQVNLFDYPFEEVPSFVADGTAEVGAFGFWEGQAEREHNLLELKGLEFHELLTSPVTVSVGPLNPLYSRKEDWVTRAMIRDYPILSTNSEMGTRLLRSLELSNPRNLLNCRDRAARRDLLDCTDCISVAGSLYLKKGTFDLAPNRRIFILADADDLRHIGIVTRKEGLLSPLAQEYVDILIEMTAE